MKQEYCNSMFLIGVIAFTLVMAFVIFTVMGDRDANSEWRIEMSSNITTKLQGKAKRDRAELNAGRASAYPEWKFRLLSDNARVLRDLGFLPVDVGTLHAPVLKRVQRGRVIYLGLPDGIVNRIQVDMRYLDSTLQWRFDMDERFAGLVVQGWDNEALFGFGTPKGVKAS